MSERHEFFGEDDFRMPKSDWTLGPAEVNKALQLIRSIVDGKLPLLPDDKKWFFTELPRKIHNTCLASKRPELEHGCRMALSALREQCDGYKLDAVQQTLVDRLQHTLVSLVPPITVGSFAKFITPKVAAQYPNFDLKKLLTEEQPMAQQRKESQWVKTEVEMNLLQQGVFGWATGLVEP